MDGRHAESSPLATPLPLSPLPNLQRGNTSLFMAAHNGHEALVRLLLEHKAIVDSYSLVPRIQTHTPVPFALFFHVQVCRLIFSCRTPGRTRDHTLEDTYGFMTVLNKFVIQKPSHSKRWTDLFVRFSKQTKLKNMCVYIP